MFKKCLSKLNFSQSIRQRNIFAKNISRYFSQTYTISEIDNFPDQLIERIKSAR